nr:MAG: replication associated protein [Cressdnaviricota sp.]
MANACTTWDFTLSAEQDEMLIDHKGIVDVLLDIARSWCFQLEEGESHYTHYQGRFVLKERQRLNGVIKMWDAYGYKPHLSITSNANRGNTFYVSKEETRLLGPWRDDDKYIPRWLKDEEPVWRPFQKTIKKRCMKECNNTRSVNVVVDRKGNNGKSYLTCWMGARDLARRIPALNDAKDMSRMILDCPKVNTYFIDLPRATDKKFLHNFISAMEELKNGYAYDDRYKFRDAYFDPPHIWIFTNQPMNTNYLSSDRWKFWHIDENFKLISGMDDDTDSLD